MKQYVDLHIHSRYSDGVHSPAALVAMAAAKGLKAIAIADHDSVSGIDEAIAAAVDCGIEVIPAVELSVEYKSYRDIHLLGYCINHRDAQLAEKLATFCTRRDIRGRAIVDRINAKLATEGVGSISYDEVATLASGALGRPHIARILIQHGYARDSEDAFNRYLVPCDVSKQYFPMEEALTEIRRVGGVAVLAHPTTITEDRPMLGALIREMADLGLDGLEVFNNMCYKDDMIYFESLAAGMGLTMTGGSDFHGFEGDVEIGSGRGGLAVAYRWVSALKMIAEKRRNPL